MLNDETPVGRMDCKLAVADLRRVRDARPLGGPNSFNFMQFLGKFGKSVCWRPPGRVGAHTSGKS